MKTNLQTLKESIDLNDLLIKLGDFEAELREEIMKCNLILSHPDLIHNNYTKGKRDAFREILKE